MAKATVELPTDEAIRRAAVGLFLRKGYEATTMREIAREVGIEAASIYNHVPSKQELLARILVRTMEEAIAQIRATVADAPADPTSQLRAAITGYVLYHDGHFAEASISDTELRSLEPDNAARVTALRDELSAIFGEIVRRGVREGAFHAPDPRMAALCVLSICARLPVWYRPDGRLKLPRIASLLADFALRALTEEG